MKYGKAAGIDNIFCEMLKALGDFGIDTLTELCNKMYHTAYIPEDLKTSVFILLPKKPRATDCSEYRTISLMCHVLKLLLTVIHKRIAQKIDSEISELQAGFRKASEYIFREIDDVPGLKMNGENINNLRYADDTVLLAESENGLQNLVTIIEEKSEQYGLMMNTKKTKVMVISKTEPPKVNIKVKGECIEQIEQFKYLGQLITTDARSDNEIKSRIRITCTKSAFTKLSHILTSKRVGLLTRLRVMKCFVWSTFLYASETWTLNKNTEKRIEAMEMWIYRRMQRISWKEKVI
ncbi:endonuclease-reverse transcriptase [Elysia marginata]|uniref:Endonuclease-reverse transcriptase n=1 Tax=Elysia marginata TaxID=1093978 RepID=A0AAV4I8B5_9GAST|nr:endonuclease-reverse transcriptase [Elysia marginata]